MSMRCNCQCHWNPVLTKPKLLCICVIDRDRQMVAEGWEQAAYYLGTITFAESQMETVGSIINTLKLRAKEMRAARVCTEA